MTMHDKTAAEKTAALKADAFELGMHALLKEAGVQDQEKADNFLKIAAQLATLESREDAVAYVAKLATGPAPAALAKATTGIGAKARKAFELMQEHPHTTAGVTVGAGALGVRALTGSKGGKKSKK